MINIRHLTLGGFLVCLAIIFQLIPVIFGEVFVLVTVLSALPIFILARINPRAGLIGLIVAGILILFFNIHEGLFFLFTNGPVGLSLGILISCTRSKILVSLGAGFVLAFTLSIMNFIIGIPVFVLHMPGTLLVQISIIFLFSIFYSSIYLWIANFIFNFFNNRYPFIIKE